MKSVFGYFYDGKTSEQWAGCIEVYDEHAVASLMEPQSDQFFNGVDPKCLTPSDMKITSLTGSHDRTLAFVNGVTFETADGQNFDDCFRGFIQQPSVFVIHRMEQFLVVAIVGLIFTLLLGYASLRWGAPLAAGWIAERLPPDLFTSKASGTLAYLDLMGMVPSTVAEAEQERLRTLFFEQFPGALDAGITLHFRSSKKFGANAFALPTGDVVFTDAMLELAKNDEELLGVFAHEWGHVHHRHVLRQIIQSGIVTWFFIMLTGDVSIGADLVTWMPALTSLAYSRDFEREADKFAMQQMNEVGLHSDHLANLLSRLWGQHFGGQHLDCVPKQGAHEPEEASSGEAIAQKDRADLKGSVCERKNLFSKLKSLFSTHPMTQERVDFLKQ